MHKLPRASGDKHVAAFKRAGWVVNHIEGSHYIMVKEGSDKQLLLIFNDNIPVKYVSLSIS